MEEVRREDISEEIYLEVLRKETHHNHIIVRDKNGILRWQEDENVRDLMINISLNDLIPMFHALGWDKNSEQYRELYRKMGYSLHGYWEIFYWEANNEEADEYEPKTLVKVNKNLKETLFDLANKFAINKKGDVAIKLHCIYNDLIT